MIGSLCLLAAAACLQQESDVPPWERGCTSEEVDQGKCSGKECPCEPVAGQRIWARSPHKRDRLVDIEYYLPESYREGVDSPIRTSVTRAFWSTHMQYVRGKDLKPVMEYCAEHMHGIFNVISAGSDTTSYPWWQGGSSTNTWFQILYGFENVTEGPGTSFEYETKFSNLPPRFCDETTIVYQEWERPHDFTRSDCEGHDVPWIQQSSYAMMELRRKDWEDKSCGHCKSAYRGIMESTYYAQWDLRLADAKPPDKAVSLPFGLEMKIDWKKIREKVTRWVIGEIPGGSTALDLWDQASEYVTVTLAPEVASSIGDIFTVRSQCLTRTDFDGDATEHPTMLRPAATAGRPRANSSGDALEASDYPQVAKPWKAPEHQKDKNGVPMNGEFLKWPTPVDRGDFSDYAQITDTVGVVPLIVNSGKSYGGGTFYLTSFPCVKARHPCTCGGDLPTGNEVPRPEPRIEPVSEPVYGTIERLGRDHFGAADVDIPVTGDEPVTVEFVGSEADDPFGWGNGMTIVEDVAKDGVVAEAPADETQPAQIKIDPKRAEKVTVVSKPELGRIFNLVFDSATKPQKRLRLRDPGDASGTKEPVRLQTGQTAGATTYQTPMLALEVDDPKNGPYTLTHDEVGKIADFTPALRVSQGDRTTLIGNFTGISKEGRSALGSASASDLNLVDANGKSTSLSDITGVVETGLARPTVNAPAKASPGEEVTIDVTGDFAHASHVSGLPRSSIVMEVYVDGAFHHEATSEQDSFKVTAPQSGVINVTARYKGDPARLAEANKAANASVNDLERTAPESAAKWFRTAYDGRSELYRTTLPK